MKNLKQRIRSGELLHGSWINLGSSVTAGIMGKAGFDWVLIDMEHGPGTESETFLQLQALENGTAAALVRVESASRMRISRVLDMGAEGVMIPQVKTIDEVKEAIGAIHYPPKGIRGAAMMIKATNFGKDAGSYYQNTEDRLVGIIQIETAEILQHLDEVASIDGVDVLFVGPSDLSLCLGVFRQFDHPVYRQTIARIARAAKNAGKAAGVHFSGMDQYDRYYELGYRFIACGADSSFLVNGAGQMVDEMEMKKQKKRGNH